MTEPQSTKNEPYADFPKQAYSIISDDFCHEKLFVLKPTVKTERSILKLKETVTYKKGAYSLAEELKLWFNLPKAGTLYTKVKSNDYVKVHYDDGVREIHGKKFFFYAGLNSNKSLDLLSVKLGVGHDSEHCHTDNRIKITNEKGEHSYFWYNRTMVYHNKLRFGLVSCFDVCHKILQKNNVLLGYDVDADTKVFLRAETDGFRHQNAQLSHPESIFDKVTFDFVRQVNSTTTAALEVQFKFILGLLLSQKQKFRKCSSSCSSQQR